MSTRPLVVSYKGDMRLFAGFWQKLALVSVVVLLVVYPFVADDYWLSLANRAMVTIVGAAALMILTGFAGQISLGHAAFFALGAYTTAILGNRFQLPFWILFVLSGSVAGIVGAIIGPFALRLKGIYLAIVTIGLIYLVNHVLNAYPDVTGGSSGISAPMYAWFPAASEVSQLGSFAQPIDIGPLRFDLELKLYLIFLPLTLLILALTKNLQRSDLGRAMMAVRDRDLAAQAMGVRLARTRVIAMILSSFLAGVGGSMLAFKQQFLTIDPPFNLQMSIEYIAIIVVGGVGTVFGAIAGALAFVYLSVLAEQVGPYLPYISKLSNSEQSILLFSILVGAILLFEPLGLFGIWLRVKRFFMTWPFRH